MHCQHSAAALRTPQLETGCVLCRSCGGLVFCVDEEGKVGSRLWSLSPLRRSWPSHVIEKIFKKSKYSFAWSYGVIDL